MIALTIIYLIKLNLTQATKIDFRCHLILHQILLRNKYHPYDARNLPIIIWKKFFPIFFIHADCIVHKIVSIFSGFEDPYTDSVLWMIDCFQFVIYCTDFFWDFCLNTNHCLKILHSYQVFWNSALIFLVVLFQNSLLFQSPSEFFSSNKCYKSKNKTQNCKSFHHFSFLKRCSKLLHRHRVFSNRE